MKRISAILTLLVLTLCLASIAHAADTSVATVKNGTLDDYPGYLIGDAFDAYFSNGSWASFTGNDGNTYVNFTGGAIYNNQPVQVLIQYRLQGGGRFQTVAYERDGRGRTWNEFNGLLAKVFDYYGNILANEENVDDGWMEEMAKQGAQTTLSPTKNCMW